jgi:hypothetical protein
MTRMMRVRRRAQLEAPAKPPAAAKRGARPRSDVLELERVADESDESDESDETAPRRGGSRDDRESEDLPDRPPRGWCDR